ncbi:MAG: DNA-binding response regulator [Alistipes sp.]
MLRAIAKGVQHRNRRAALPVGKRSKPTAKLMLKLGARNMAELVVKAISLGIVTV